MCGVVGIIGTAEASREAFLALTTLQHRGQDAAGILTFDSRGFHRVKNVGLVESVFNRQNMETLTGNVAVAHARYSTIGHGDLIDVQPFLTSYPYGIGMVHNGNIVNVGELAEDLKKRGRRHLLTHSDTEIVMNLFSEGLAKSSPGADGRLSFDQICESVSEIHRRVNGSYSIITLVADHGLVAFRDPLGNRPLVWGKRPERRSGDAASAAPTGEAHMVASESVALTFNGYEIVRNLEPGEVLYIDLEGQVHTRVLTAAAPARSHCMFEWVYFAAPDSTLEDSPVYGARINLGRHLGRLVREELKKRGLEADVVVPVPDSGRIAAISLAEELGLPYREVLIKNRYIKRTFILDSQDKRQKAVRLKLSPVRSEIEGKRILLVDDSIVRGTTSSKLIELVRQAGAEKVYFVSTCPPIQHPCYYGIDFPDERELVASGRSTAEIEKLLGADAVIYQDVEGLRQSIADAGRWDDTSRLCMACITGKYPSDISAGRRFAEKRVSDRKRLGEG